MKFLRTLLCFFYSLPKKKKEIVKRYDGQLKLFDDTEVENKYLIKGYDHINSNFIVIENYDIIGAKWGLIPFWTDQEFAKVIIKTNRNVNARKEKIFTTPSFRYPIEKRRCLIPATGWYEYHYENGKVENVYYMTVKDTDIFSFAGIYDFWRDKETGERTPRYAIITSPANNTMMFIHNGGRNPHRMPVILHPEDEATWLNPQTSNEKLQSLMQPFPDNQMEARPLKINPIDFRVCSPYDERIGVY